MRVLTGPAGSGKTAVVLDGFRAALRAGRDDVRLLVPTATMVEHAQNAFGREGFVFRRSLVQTLSGFVETRTRDVRQVSEPVLYLIVEDAARRVNRVEFARVAGMPGFCASVARTIAEFSSAGCDSARLEACLPEAPLAAAFLAVFREVDRELERRGLTLRARRLEIAAERIEREGVAGIATIWLDGFHALPDPELRVIAALARRADVTLAIGESDLDGRIRALADRIERREKSRPSPAVAIVRAPGIERECDEIARRIVEQSAAGRPFREIGIIVRSADAYVPILRSTLERFGIPARFYFDEDLERHPEVRFAVSAVDAMLAGWDHEATLAALRVAPGFENSASLDCFDFAVRTQVPNAGLETLRELGPPAELLDRLTALEAWRELRLTPRDWVGRVNGWARSRLLEDVTAEAAVALEGASEVGLREFWRAMKAVLRLTPLRAPDRRRNVVNVLSAHEARQWVLPVVFVCGMVEKQFPQFHRQDPFFPDAARRALHTSGVRVRTAEQFEREERALFESAVTRGTLSVTLTFPEFDARGDRNLPSLFLESFALPVDSSRSVRPAPRARVALRSGWTAGAPGVRSAGYLGEKTARVSPTGLESFLQCPFQYFAGRMLRLQGAPPTPAERLDFLTQGQIVHEVLAAWWAERPDIAALFEAVFLRTAEAGHIPISYQTERARFAMLDDLRRFAAKDDWLRADYESHTELEFEFALSDSVSVRGKIDRLDVARDGRAVVIDYKYSNAQRIKAKLENENLLQAPLYLMAAERTFGRTPGSMYYVGVKGGVEYAQWEPAGDWIGRTTERTLRVVDDIRGGRIEVAPADVDHCRFCDARDICRIETRQAAAIAEGA